MLHRVQNVSGIVYSKEKALGAMLLRRGRTIPRSKGSPRIQKPRPKRLELLADGREPIDLVPATPDPDQAQAALRAAPAEVRDVAVATPALPDGTKSDNRELALNFRVLLAKGEKLMKLGRTIAHSVELAECLVG